MKYSLFVLPLLASVAFAQDDDVWKNVKRGDRVQVTFRSGNMILGSLANKPGDPRVSPVPVDYSTATDITLDLSLEYPGLNGTMTIPRKEIKELRKLQNIDAATLKRIQDEMKRIQDSAAKDDEERRLRESERDRMKAKDREKAEKEDKDREKDREKGGQLLKEFEDLQKAKDVLKRFPPPQWGPKVIAEIGEKGIRRQPITAEEREFSSEETQRLWNLAFKAQQDAEGDKKKEKPEEKK